MCNYNVHFSLRLKIRDITVLPSHMFLSLKQMHEETKYSPPYSLVASSSMVPPLLNYAANESVLQCSLPSMQAVNNAPHGNIEGVVEYFLLC